MIDGRCFDVLVAEPECDDGAVSAVMKEVHRERMPQGMERGGRYELYSNYTLKIQAVAASIASTG
jgi:hypothetical protein